MTVGQELANITDLRLFHNHMMIEPVLEVFREFRWDTIERLRNVIFVDYSTSENYGLIFTFMWGFDDPSDWDYVARIVGIFEKANAEIFYAELHAPREVRLQRNTTENRLKHKASMRNTENSSRVLLTNTGRYSSYDGEIPFANYIRIDNTDLSAGETARIVKDKFML